MTLWLQEDVDPKQPWSALPKELWDALEFWARSAGGIVRLFFGVIKPKASVTFHTYASERAFDVAYDSKVRPHWDWCDDTGQFNFETDDMGSAHVSSWFPDSPDAQKTYYLAWDESRSGYWASCPDEYPFTLEDAMDCTVNEAVVLSELFLEYEPFSFERQQHRISHANEHSRILKKPYAPVYQYQRQG